MSIFPSPDEFIRSLYQTFQKLPSDVDATVGHALLEPLQQYIRDSGTDDASILNLERELNPLRDKSIAQIKAPHQASETEASAKIYHVFANSLASSSSSYTPTQKASMSEEAISSFELDLARANVIVSDVVRDKRAFQQSIAEECALELAFAGESSEFSIRPAGSQAEPVMLDMLKTELPKVESITIDGSREIVPHLFKADVLDEQTMVPYSFLQSRSALLTRSSVRDFFTQAEHFIQVIAPNAKRDEKLNLFRILMLMNTRLVSNFFFGKLCSYFNTLLSSSGNPLRADVRYDVKFEPFPGEPLAFVVRMDASLLILPDHLKTLSKHEIDRFFSEEGINHKLSVDFSICFEIGFMENALHFRCRENDGRIQYADPYSILSLSAEKVSVLQRNIQALQQHLRDRFDQVKRECLSSIPENLRTSMLADVGCEDWLTADYALVSVPMPFLQDHLSHQRASTVRYSIGEASPIKVTTAALAESLTEKVDAFASIISKNPLIKEVLFNQILLCCSQQLSNPVCSFLLQSLNLECRQRMPAFETEIRIEYGDVKITQATGVFGRKDDEIAVRYSFHALICPDRGEPNPKAKSFEKTLGIEKIISVEISGSFTITAGKKSSDVKVKDIRAAAKLE